MCKEMSNLDIRQDDVESKLEGLSVVKSPGPAVLRQTHSTGTHIL